MRQNHVVEYSLVFGIWNYILFPARIQKYVFLNGTVLLDRRDQEYPDCPDCCQDPIGWFISNQLSRGDGERREFVILSCRSAFFLLIAPDANELEYFWSSGVGSVGARVSDSCASGSRTGQSYS